MIKSDLLGALARGYCSEKNSCKTVDPDLIESMAEEVLLLYCKKQGNFDEGSLNIKDFQKELEQLINRHSKENGSNTPDWVLASYLVRCLEAFDACIELLERYYGREKLHGFVTRIENQP
jgi:hypothetical protein